MLLRTSLVTSRAKKQKWLGGHGMYGRKWATAFLWAHSNLLPVFWWTVFRMVALLLSQTEVLTYCWICQYLIGSLTLEESNCTTSGHLLLGHMITCTLRCPSGERSYESIAGLARMGPWLSTWRWSSECPVLCGQVSSRPKIRGLNFKTSFRYLGQISSFIWKRPALRIFGGEIIYVKVFSMNSKNFWK